MTIVSGPAASLAGRVYVIWMAKIFCGHRRAQQMAGFPYSEIPHLITVGFGRQTLLGAADTLIDLVSRENCVISSCLVAVTAHAASATTSPISPPACRMTA